jgi:hypothetical protein
MVRGDGVGNFKQPTYNAATDHIAPHLSQGPVKTGTMPVCRTKWTMVRFLKLIICSLISLFFDKIFVAQIKSIYTAIETCRNQLGFYWDNDHGANIVGDAADTVWKAYLKPKVRRWYIFLMSILFIFYFFIVECMLAPLPKPWMGVLQKNASNHTQKSCSGRLCLSSINCFAAFTAFASCKYNQVRTGHGRP